MKEQPLKREVRKSYAELLEKPEWLDFAKQMKALRGFQCEHCGSLDDLKVHHLGYKDGRKPWEYSESEVIVLCQPCHSELHEFADRLWNDVLKCRNMWVVYECAKAVRNTLQALQP